MKKALTLVAAAAAFLLSSCSSPAPDRPYNEGINILPVPAQIDLQQGVYTLTSSTLLSANNAEAEAIAQFFAQRINRSTGFSLAVKQGEQADGIQLHINPALDMHEEGYHLTVTPTHVQLEAKTPAGAFYGMQTLMQLLPAEIESTTPVKNIAWTVQACDIQDQPRFSYRGFHYDPCRHFFSKEELMKLIDMASVFKMNKLHFHLTEDQGWRIEIKKYPKLTEIGSKRIDDDGTEYGGYYTQDDIKEIVAYAQERFIDIIPEIDLPGHMLAAIAAYPNLSCHNDSITPRIIWGIEDIVLCPGKEDMFIFLEDVFAELCALFPSTYFHIGGDESPRNQWENCELCQAKIKELGIKAQPGKSAEAQLQAYVTQRMEQMLAKYGKKVIGWDEILEGGISDNATVMSWRGTEGGIAAALLGHDAIMTPSSEGAYLDYYQGDNKIEPVAIGGYFPLNRTYSYEPVADTLNTLGLAHHILGVQGNVWTEYIPTPEILEYRMFPRILAIAETGWSPAAKKDFADFCHRLDNVSVRMDLHNINYHIPQPEQPGGSCNFVAFTGPETSLEFTTTRPVKMVYTLDGSTPNAQSTVYTQPITVSKNSTLKICALLPSGKTSPVRTITIEKQTLAPATDKSDVKPGLAMRMTYGKYFNSKELEQVKDWQEKIITNTSEISHQEPTTEDMRHAKFYSAIAEGYIDVPADGVYYLSSNNEEVWLDDQLIISNAGEVKRFSRHDTSRALAKGLHRVKIVFCGNMYGGWPTQWDDASIQMRPEKAEKFERIKPEQLFH